MGFCLPPLQHQASSVAGDRIIKVWEALVPEVLSSKHHLDNVDGFHTASVPQRTFCREGRGHKFRWHKKTVTVTNQKN